MLIMSQRMEVLRLYKNILRESQKFSSYNFRNYALRRARDAFKENKSLDSTELIEKQLKEAKRNLEVIKRQVTIGNMFQTHKLVIEQQKPK